MNMKKQNREQQRLSLLFLFIIGGMIFELWLFNREKANIFLYYRFPLTSILPLDYTNKNINCLKLPNFMAILWQYCQNISLQTTNTDVMVMLDEKF